MSEKEKTGASGASLVVVEQTRLSRHKPIPPKDLEEDTSVEVHHKLSKPAVHSAVTEELKNVEEILLSDYERTEEGHESWKEGSDGEVKAVFSKQHHHHHGKQESSSEAIALTAVDAVEVKVSQPIPSSHIDLPPSIVKVTHSHESIADEVTELRTNKEPAIASRWASPRQVRKISPQEPIIENQHIGDKSDTDMEKGSGNFLVQKSSFGPYIHRTPQREPSGIAFCITQASPRQVRKISPQEPIIENQHIGDKSDTDMDKGSGNFLVQKSSFGPYIHRTPQREPSGLAFCIAQRSSAIWTENNARAPSGIAFSYHKFKQQSIHNIESIEHSTGDDGDSHVEGKLKSNLNIPTFTEDSTSNISSLKSDSEDSVNEITEVTVKNSKWKSFLHHLCPNWK